MVKIKLQGITKGVTAGGTAVTTGFTNAFTAGGDAVSTGLTGLFTLGQGFRDFILKSSVVDLAVAVVLGSAFTNLIAAVTEDFITPLIAAIFQGTSFAELSFYINGSRFKYGHFINAFIVFVIVLVVLYFGVVMPLQKLQYAAFKSKAIMRDCPHCLEEISMAATRCKFCCGEIVIDEEMQQVITMATAAMEAEQQKQSMRWLTRCFRCCIRQPKAVLKQQGGSIELETVADAAEVDEVGQLRRMSSSGSGGQAGGVGSTRRSSTRFATPSTSFNQQGHQGGPLHDPVAHLEEGLAEIQQSHQIMKQL